MNQFGLSGGHGAVHFRVRVKKTVFIKVGKMRGVPKETKCY